MFQSYQYLKYLGYDPKVRQHKWEYKIVDSDFEHIAVGVGVAVGVAVGVRVGVGVGVAVIDTYSQKGLAVAPNLIRALLWYGDKHGYTLDQLVKLNKLYNPRWHEVEKDMQKYLLFT